MSEWTDFLLVYGYGLVLVSVFLEQMGLPLPAVPLLIGMGALSRSDQVSFVLVIVLSLVASLAADLVWYRLGARHGRSVLQLICRISLEPDYCVRRTEDAYVRRGIWTLLFAKFVPGLNAAAVPLAGMIRTPLHRFLAFDALGLVFWAGTYTALGYVLSDQIQSLLDYVSGLGLSFFVVAAALVTGYVAYKIKQRNKFMKSIEVERITPEELKAKLESKEKVVVLDLRNQLDVRTDRVRIPGAFHALPEMLGEADLPPGEQVVLYCTCPNEATSARVALHLRRLGIPHVRPLAGGLEAWRERGFPVEAMDL